MVSFPPFLFLQRILDDTFHVSNIILGAGDREVEKTEKIFPTGSSNITGKQNLKNSGKCSRENQIKAPGQNVGNGVRGVLADPSLRTSCLS